MLASTIVAVIAFALLAFIANRRGRQIISAFLAAGAWLFLASGVLIWLWRLRGPHYD
jgi:vacuolar-type H+-ATPase subunit I/STV1